ncbi:MAG TPA: HAMP domain-containing sensor histidine kinase [Pseudobacteroides sp.]|uniref:sensor histidine kinase n=1 Tax=Pseudobacteroides sp. TaxID=1968840 RepID=UPI002F938C84
MPKRFNHIKLTNHTYKILIKLLMVISVAIVFFALFYFLYSSLMLSSDSFIFIQLITIVILVASLAIIQFLKHNPSSKSSREDCGKELHPDLAPSQLKLLEELTILNKQLTENDKRKTEFFSNISHELKTPISIILGAIQLIEAKCPPYINDKRKSSKYHKTIKHNCYRLLRLINNLLDITRMDSGFIKLNTINYNIVYLIEEIVQSIAPYSNQKGLIMEFDTEEEEIFMSVDVDKIERIILNLLSNAIKFTPAGGKIFINIKRNGDSVLVSVKDTGPGIPKSLHSEIFDRFKQTNSSLTRENEGSGIGLSLVKSFVSLHNGNISLNSEEGHGSEFIIELPVLLNCESREPVTVNSSNGHRIIEAINIEFSDIY